MDLPITIYLAPISMAFSGVEVFLWSSLLSVFNLIPGVTIRSNRFLVFIISEAGQITPSIPDSLAMIKSFSTI